MATALAYLIYGAAAALCFAILPVRHAILAIFLGGWLMLPVGHYPPIGPRGVLPWWITGAAVPSSMLLTKAWTAPAVALAGAATRDFEKVRRWRPMPIDGAMAAWCLWPLVDGLLAPRPSPSPLVATLYVTGAWGLPWVLGRVWFGTRHDQRTLLRGLGVAGAACLPLALLEGVHAPFLYDAFYGRHPFRLDGAQRYIGFRPLGFFEDGNQYGIWTALCALAAIWSAAARSDRREGRLWLGIALVAGAIALAGQSVGAILLLLAGLAIFLLWRVPFAKPMLAGLGLLVALAGIVHLSGIVPLEAIARRTNAGERMLGAFRAIGRGSFLWRLSQDVRTLPSIKAAPIAGAARWDWFAPFGTRPWGLAMLIVGQYGVIGLALAFGTPAAGAAAALARLRVASIWARDAVRLPVALIVLLALADGLLNAFFFFPAMLCAGAVAARAPLPNHPRRA